MGLYAVNYEYVDDPARLAEVRPAHRLHLEQLFKSGSLIASGPLGGVGAEEAPRPAGALLIVEANYPDEALEILDADPFWIAGLITHRDARAWTLIYGAFSPPPTTP
ncbi:MAG: YciI family protein [Bifidobacteriaceae bacterium]|nr:YciI family protein [Bifidobacteriaceae bacterium]